MHGRGNPCGTDIHGKRLRFFTRRRTAQVAIPARYSRHYYDQSKLANSAVKDSALSDLTLLKNVVEFKERFYYSSWARYDLAQPGTFRLVPPASQTSALARDYRAMRDMFYREPPEFGVIMEGLAALELEINALQSR